MGCTPKLVLFDVDGTLVDSQENILSAFYQACEGFDITPPDRQYVMGTVGLSLPLMFSYLFPDISQEQQSLIIKRYKNIFAQQREKGAYPPVFEGIQEILRELGGREHVILGVATGKSRRGLESVLHHYDWAYLFYTTQVADDHPSKPNPAMILQAMAETGIPPQDTVMIGDTHYDIEMAHNANVSSIGVSWGYHNRNRLKLAHRVIDTPNEILSTVDDLIGIH